MPSNSTRKCTRKCGVNMFLKLIVTFCFILLFRFEFVKSIGSNILPIKLQVGQELNARVLKHIIGTSPIYVRALEEINSREEARMKMSN